MAENTMRKAAIVLDEVIEAAPVSWFQWRVVFVCLLITSVEGYDVQALSFAAPLLTKHWGLQPSALGIALTATVLGVIAGTAFVAPRGDSLGRRPTVIASLAIAGLFTFATLWAQNIYQVSALRFIAGIGLGGATPNLLAVALEHMPQRRRMLSSVLITSGFPLGAAIGGAVAGRMSVSYDWPAIFFLGGIVTLACALVAIIWLPESPAFAIGRPKLRARLVRTLMRIDPTLQIGSDQIIKTNEHVVSGPRYASLFREGRAPTTLLLSVIFFANMATMYFFITWLPSLFVQRGLGVPEAIRASAIFSAGGVIGGLGLALSLRKVSPTIVLGTAYAVAAAAILSLSYLSVEGFIFAPIIFAAGLGIVGGQFVLNAIVAQYYPTSIRATGIGLVSGVGRVGAVAAPVAGGLIMQMANEVQTVFVVAVIPALIAVAAVACLWFHHRASMARRSSELVSYDAG